MRRAMMLGPALILAAACGGGDRPAPAKAPAGKPDAAAVTPAELIDIDRAFSARSKEVGTKTAFAEFIAEDGVLLPTGAEAKKGAAAIARHLAEAKESGVLTWTPEEAVVAASGDVGATWGRYELVLAGAAPLAGKYVTVWRRGEDGKWRARMAIGNK